MPIECSVEIAKLTTDEFKELDYVVMRHAFDPQNCLGRLADERIYQSDLAPRISSAGLDVKREFPLRLTRLRAWQRFANVLITIQVLPTHLGKR